jgi:hypothetical protein
LYKVPFGLSFFVFSGDSISDEFFENQFTGR